LKLRDRVGLLVMLAATALATIAAVAFRLGARSHDQRAGEVLVEGHAR
jgi:hypothetical protein